MRISKTRPRKKAARRRSTSEGGRGYRYVLLDGNDDWRDRLGRNESFVCSTRENMLDAIENSTKDSVWISSKPERTEELLQAIGAFLDSHRGSQKRLGSLFMLQSPRPSMLPPLHGCFREVIGEVRSFKTLPADQLIEVFAAPKDRRRDVFIGGIVDQATRTLALVRGDFERLTIPLSVFRRSGKASPNFRSFALDDYGRTLRFGDYEASSDVILWEADPDYRKRVRAQEKRRAKGLGPSLRRLRKQRGLSQADFPSVSRKTISRIEKGEIERPREVTLKRIAKALGVEPEEIETF